MPDQNAEISMRETNKDIHISAAQSLIKVVEDFSFSPTSLDTIVKPPKNIC